MKHAAILRRIHQALRQRTLRYSPHAVEEMDAEGETRRSVEAALSCIRSISPQENERWRVRAEGLVVILHIDEDQILVWTVYAG